MGIPGFVVLQDGTSQYVEDQQTFLVQNPSARPFVLQPIPEYTHRKTPSGKQGSRQQKPNAGQLAAQREDEMWERMEREAQSMLYCGCICGMTAVTCDGCAGRGR